jgi:hypothetical protein
MKDTFSTVSLTFFLNDLNTWIVDRIDKVDASRGTKPPEVYYDRGMINAFREVHTLIKSTLITTHD